MSLLNAVVADPRARGDLPELAFWSADRRGPAPRPRGSSAADRRRRGRSAVGPASAGILRGTSGRWSSRSGRPRARGDPPATTSAAARMRTSAPRSRGSSVHLSALLPGNLVDPALAGILLARRLLHVPERRRPRARGDPPRLMVEGGGTIQSAPRSRGSSSSAGSREDVTGVGPALAGILRRRRRAPGALARRPRARGDPPSIYEDTAAHVLSAPRPRGSSRDEPVRRAEPGRRPRAAGILPPCPVNARPPTGLAGAPAKSVAEHRESPPADQQRDRHQDQPSQ
ncbi:hypothetical protein STTU_p0091 (plasmid) [Streptomyces sp. Tu6071]|nr:hypothetical protein STTU_p0091 [Streptomyces sp. Tu6071]